MGYLKLLKDSRWKFRSKSIKERDEFTCKKCGDKKKELNVHHLYYIIGLNPWDYPNNALITLCVDCHVIEHKNNTIPILKNKKKGKKKKSSKKKIKYCYDQSGKVIKGWFRRGDKICRGDIKNEKIFIFTNTCILQENSHIFAG
jgi:hypothetical protein